MCPEGDHWVEVSTSEDINLVQISVGPSGMLWGCTWDGNVAVRKGISHSHPTGRLGILKIGTCFDLFIDSFMNPRVWPKSVFPTFTFNFIRITLLESGLFLISNWN